ncbi:hypothetical protein DKG77_00600 [Flagellimonas aquimarina]|jgi:hypothetical protein|uniref:Flavodoxin-like domain-containing protein n=1 Tax=Flagellimonas aquimarina TaxID=2201895 RepID=A0A316L0K4_9FLAO|nr:hypothetical protein [Allomuricauda koreensis]PWL39371.1 hypothetical protein DKG77_00600 [Allomuricauda koreensis]
MKSFKEFLILILFAVGLSLLFTVWYNQEFSLAKVEAIEVTNPELESKLLIACTEGKFPEKIGHGIIDHYKNNYNLSLVDISDLSTINQENYEGIFLIHTWEKWNPPPDIVKFMDISKKFNDKIVIMATSSGGSSQTDDVDGITGGKESENVQFYVKEAITKMDSVLDGL